MNRQSFRLYQSYLKPIITKICDWLEDTMIYEVRVGNQTKWITREEWLREQKQNLIKNSYQICKSVKGSKHESN